MRKYLFFVFLLSNIQTVYSQQVQDISFHTLRISKDSLEVTLQLDEVADSSSISIWAFQFDLKLNNNVDFIGISTTGTLSDKPGWTTAANLDRKRVGGFSSSKDAIISAGPLIKMLFAVKKEIPNICLSDIKLNSGNPKTISDILCIEYHN